MYAAAFLVIICCGIGSRSFMHAHSHDTTTDSMPTVHAYGHHDDADCAPVVNCLDHGHDSNPSNLHDESSQHVVLVPVEPLVLLSIVDVDGPVKSKSVRFDQIALSTPSLPPKHS